MTTSPNKIVSQCTSPLPSPICIVVRQLFQFSLSIPHFWYLPGVDENQKIIGVFYQDQDTLYDNGRRTEVFFFPPSNRFSDVSPYNRLQVIQHCSVISLSFFFKKLQSGLFFLPFLFFFRQRHLLFCLSASLYLYLFHIFLWKFCL